MSKHVHEVKAKCDACGGTGLYVGLAEKDGIAVVCHTCKGNGWRMLRLVWEDFEGLVERPGIRRVIQANPGIVCGEGKSLTLEAFGGMPVEKWRKGDAFPPGLEMRLFTCPAWWYQSADSSQKPNWKECNGGAFYNCSHFPDKAACWERFDREKREKAS